MDLDLRLHEAAYGDHYVVEGLEALRDQGVGHVEGPRLASGLGCAEPALPALLFDLPLELRPLLDGPFQAIVEHVVAVEHQRFEHGVEIARESSLVARSSS